jgi:cell division protein FtsW (lipid II flippase)
MLLYHLYYVEYLCIGMIIISLLITVFVLYAYSVNSQRASDDPEKRDFHIGAILFASFTWPFFLFAFVSLFIIRALFYGLFLILFSMLLILIPRKSSELTWLEKNSSRIGEALLKANTKLINLFLKPWSDEPETI